VKPFNPKEFVILIVDDVTTNLKVVGSILDRVGYCTTFATSGQQAWERIQSAATDLILLDIMMPQMNGLEFCAKLKADLSYRDIPIIFLTAKHEQDTMMQAFEEGAVDYITKPFNSAELLARVKIHLELKHTRDQLEKTLEELERLATTDALTGISNRRHLFALAEKEFNRAGRYGTPLSVFMIDADHFKQINDNYGHAVGDETLKFIAQTTRNLLRKFDLFGRIGGEEFVVFVPETDIEQAIKVANRICETLENTTLEIEDQTIRITVSIGVATYESNDRKIDRMLQRADQALYEAKSRGRNQVLAYESNVGYF
jgi:diguanylate cyclase (GGDEF)-like protein